MKEGHIGKLENPNLDRDDSSEDEESLASEDDEYKFFAYNPEPFQGELKELE